MAAMAAATLSWPRRPGKPGGGTPGTPGTPGSPKGGGGGGREGKTEGPEAGAVMYVWGEKNGNEKHWTRKLRIQEHSRVFLCTYMYRLHYTYNMMSNLRGRRGAFPADDVDSLEKQNYRLSFAEKKKYRSLHCFYTRCGSPF